MRYLKYWVMVVGLMAINVHAASFDCSKSETNVEKMICASPDISDLDDQVGSLYKWAQEHSSDIKSLKSAQRTWLKGKRNLCMDNDCLSQAYKDRIDELSRIIAPPAPDHAGTNQKLKWHIIEGGPYKLCNQIYDLVANNGQATALRQSAEPLLKIKGVSLPEKEDFSGEDFYFYNGIASSREQAADFVKRVHEIAPGTKWVRFRVNYDNHGEDEFIIQEETPGSLNDPTYSILNSNMKLIGRNKTHHARVFLLNGDVFTFWTGERNFAVLHPEYIGAKGVPISTPFYCKIETIKN